MAFDTSGNFTRTRGAKTWQDDATAKVKIRADLHDANDNDIANSLSDCITRHGWSQIAQDIPWGGKKITNLGLATDPGDALSLGYFDASAVRYDKAQALSILQQLQAHQNLAATATVFGLGGTYTLLQSDRRKLLQVDSACVVTLPLASLIGNDFSVDFKVVTGPLTLHPTGGATIEGLATDLVIGTGAFVTLWCNGTNWVVQRLFGGLALFKKTLVTVTNAAWPIDDETKWIYLELQGSGGAGGSSNGGTTGTCGSGAGGGGGGFVSKFFARPSAAKNLTANILISAGGAAGLTAGGDGSITRWVDAVNTITANGGQGGNATGAVTSLGGALGGVGGDGSGGDMYVVGGAGVNSLSLGTSFSTGVARMSWGGKGGDCFWGSGGQASVNASSGSAASFLDGNPGRGWGGGGGGGGSINTNGAGSGGHGAQGAAMVWEFR